MMKSKSEVAVEKLIGIIQPRACVTNFVGLKRVVESSVSDYLDAAPVLFSSDLCLALEDMGRRGLIRRGFRSFYRACVPDVNPARGNQYLANSPDFRHKEVEAAVRDYHGSEEGRQCYVLECNRGGFLFYRDDDSLRGFFDEHLSVASKVLTVRFELDV